MLDSGEATVARLLNHPHSVISLSDAGAHPRFLDDAGFGIRLLDDLVRERGAMRLQEAVWRLTQRSAEIFGLPGRARLREGLAADLLLFDRATVSRSRGLFDVSGGAARLHTDATLGGWVIAQFEL